MGFGDDELLTYSQVARNLVFFFGFLGFFFGFFGFYFLGFSRCPPRRGMWGAFNE